jgi:hypothetical protein
VAVTVPLALALAVYTGNLKYVKFKNFKLTGLGESTMHTLIQFEVGGDCVRLHAGLALSSFGRPKPGIMMEATPDLPVQCQDIFCLLWI